MTDEARLLQRVSELARAAAEEEGALRLFVLFGSRARGDAHERSDWDFGFLAGPTFDVAMLQSRLIEALGTEAVDLVDLANASGLLRFRAARDGEPLFERSNAWEVFWLESVHFWCEAGPILREAYGELLEELRG